MTPLDTAQSAVLLNAITAFALVLLTNRLLRRVVRTDLLVTLGTVTAALGASSMVFGHLLMTDFAFIAITLALFLALVNHRRSDEPAWLVVAVVLVWAGFMIRYAGIVNIATGAVWLMTDRRRTIAARLRTAAVFAAASAVVPVLWVLRNLRTDDTALGVRYSSARGLLGNVFDSFATIGNFLTPGVAIESRAIWAAVAVAGCALMALMLWKVLLADERSRSLAGGVDIAASVGGLLVVHILVYGAYMIYARTTTGLNRLDFRLLNPLYLPLTIVGLGILDRVIRSSSRAPWPRLARATAIAWAGLNVALGVVMIGYFATSPDLFVGNYERAAFDDVRSSRALEAIPTGCRVSSNLPNALYEAGIEAQWSPRNTGLESNDPVDDVERLEDDVERHDHCLVWIDEEPTYGHLATLGELRDHFRLERLASARHVTVYRFEPR